MCAQPQSIPPPADAILIIGVSPESFLDAQETEVTAIIAYHLTSSEEGMINLNSNELHAQAFSPFAHLRVKRGSGTVSVSGKMMPRYWSSNAPAKISVSLNSITDDPVIQRRPLATDDTVKGGHLWRAIRKRWRFIKSGDLRRAAARAVQQGRNVLASDAGDAAAACALALA